MRAFRAVRAGSGAGYLRRGDEPVSKTAACAGHGWLLAILRGSAGVWLWILLCSAAEGGTAAAAASPLQGLSSAVTNEQVDINADELEYDRENFVVRARGNVVIRSGDDELRADSVVLNTATHEARAAGNVKFKRPGLEWAGERFTYNFTTRKWESASFESFMTPYHVRSTDSAAEDLEGGGVAYVLHDATITTCSEPFPAYHYYLTAREVRIIPGDRLQAESVVVHAGPVPMFYLPYWSGSMTATRTGLRIAAGYRSSMGAYLLSTYRYELADGFEGATHLDYRTLRGVAVGQDVTWRTIDNKGRGGVYAYYLDDQGLSNGDYPSDSGVEPERYRFRVRHDQTLAARTYFKTEWNYLSDSYMLEDFYKREYSQSQEPENFATVVRSYDRSLVSLTARTQLNDFYTAVSRLPELEYDYFRNPIDDSGFYYESKSTASVLQKHFSETDGGEDYSALRADSSHYVYYPTKEFGFLSVVPRAGYRGTVFSKTKEDVTTTEVTTTVTTNTSSSGGTEVTSATTTNSVTTAEERNAKYRSVVEVGLETSLKSFKAWRASWLGEEKDFRHVLEPYANLTLMPEPSVKPDELYQFDEVDAIGKNYSGLFGVRNKIQEKRDGRPFDLIDLNLYTTYIFEQEYARDTLTNVVLKAQVRLLDRFPVDIDATWEPNTGVLTVLDTRVGYVDPNAWWILGEYLYEIDNIRLVSATLALQPNKTWDIATSGRYEMESSRLEEVGLSVTRNLDCMFIKTGLSYTPSYIQSDGTQHGDDYSVRLEIWLTAFPDVRIGSSPRD